MGDFPFLSPKFCVSCCGYVHTALGCWATKDISLHRCWGFFFCWKRWIPGITKARKLSAKCLWCRARKGSCWEHPAMTSTSGRESVRENGMSEQEGAPTWRSVRAEMAGMFGNEQCSQRVKSLWQEAVGVVYKRCFTKKRTQIDRNYSPPLLLWYFTV